ncbi:unnamed protein product [Hydatigera taeniaeformis]|uniref:Glutaredoxin domain-containing protein n=1 Tax=Hydatigena taeniaeformis TaxID=6205 RepID=A0A0R3X0M6_HYDTA|nr:unnamed protein product [Hydatigera taeniaeformis]
MRVRMVPGCLAEGVKITPVVINYRGVAETTNIVEGRFINASDITILVFRGTVISQEIRGELVRLGVRIHDVWRNKGSVAQRYLPSHVRRNQAPVIPVWVPLTNQLKSPHSTCVCPRFVNDQSYLFISQAYEASVSTDKL